MRYRSQSWLNNKTRGANWIASASYVTGSHSMKFGYQGNCWRDDREMHVNYQNLGYTLLLPGARRSSRCRLTEYANPYFVNARGDAGVALRAGSMDDEAPDAAGRAALRPSVELVPGAGRPAEEPLLPRRHFARTDGVTGYNDITPRMGAAYDLFGNGKTALKVNLGKYLQGASVSNLAYGAEPVAADSGRRRPALSPAVGQSVRGPTRRRLRCRTAT